MFLLLAAGASFTGQAAAGTISFRGAITEPTCQADLTAPRINFDKCPNAAHSASFELQTLRNVQANQLDANSPRYTLSSQTLEAPSADRTSNGYFSAVHDLDIPLNAQDSYIVFVNYN